MLHREAVNTGIFELIRALQKQPCLRDFFLVGGTGLALQIGHRESNDIDLFNTGDFDQAKLLELLENDFKFNMDFIDNNTIKGEIGDVKVDLISHKYDMIDPVIKDEGIRLAAIPDIAAMKINAIVNDGTRVKDFIDIYFLLREYEMPALIDYFKSKYKLRNALHALKSLTYFDDVNIEDWPELVKEKELKWEQVKKLIEKSGKDYIYSITD